MKKIIDNKVVSYLLIAVIFLLPLSAKFATIFIILALVASLISADWATFKSDLLSNRFFVISILFYGLHLIGLLYSSNLDYGFRDIQTKLSFLIFPVLFVCYKPTHQQIEYMKAGLIAGCLLGIIICAFNALSAYQNNFDGTMFFYTSFSRFMHPTYFGFYLNVCLIFLMDYGYRRISTNNSLATIFYFLIVLILIAGELLLSARMAMMVTAFTLSAFLVINYIMRKQGWLTLAWAVILVVGVMSEIQLNKYYNRFSQIERAIEKNDQQPSVTNSQSTAVAPESYNSTTSRVALWKYATELITSSPLIFVAGVGTGDIKDELREVYVRNNFEKGAIENYNPHNQYLHTMVIAGLIGLLLLLSLLLFPLFYSIKWKQYVPAVFLVVIMLNALTESILEVQSGIIFFCFIFCMLVAELNLNAKQTVIK